jgi:tetratricopeptide (TPR) repeat protein
MTSPAILEPGSARRRTAVVVLLCAAALLYRLWILWSVADLPTLAVPQGDGAFFHAWARDIAERSFWGDDVFFFDPLYAYFLGILYATVGQHFWAICALQALLGVLGLWLLYDGARRLFGFPVAAAALSISAVYRTLAFYDVILAKDFLGPLLLEAAFCAAARALTTGRSRGWVVAGATLALAGLVRGNLLVLIPILAVTAWFIAGRMPRNGLLVLAGAGAILLPVAARNLAVGGEFVLTAAQMGTNLYIGNQPGNDTGRYEPPAFLSGATPLEEFVGFQREAERRLGRPLGRGEVSTYWRDEALKAILAEPGRFLWITAKRIALLGNRREVPDIWDLDYLAERALPLRLPAATFGLVAPLALWGMLRARRERKAALIPFLFVAVPLGSVALFFVFDRYRLPAVPFLGLFAACGLVHVWNAYAARARQPLAVGLALVAGAAAWVNLPIERFVDVGRFDFSISHYNDALALIQLRRTTEAIPHLEAVLRLRPEYRTHASLNALLGQCYDRQGDMVRAADHYQIAATARPDLPTGWLLLAKARLASGDTAGARRAFASAEEAARRTPPEPDVAQAMTAFRARLP